jgi:acyl-coenzyme A synthetase/AMP-(fatty) acid ligase
MGARLSLALRSRAVGKLHATVHDGYGANETGPISVVDADGAGDILPDVEVEVVDDEGKVLPDGELGRIRVRSASQISGYLEPEHDRRYLQGGWFDTGDMGKIVSPRRLLVLGRPDAMLNVGGLKVAAEEIEDLLMRGAIAGDSAVCTIPGPDGIHELYVAVVDAPGDDSQLATAVGRHLGGNFGHIRILRLNKIPRGSGGKVLRLELARLVASLVGQAR